MEQFDIYSDIAARTNGDIYIGVVGPVRTGKSTFVTKVMESLVLPNIKNKNARQRATDELPQAGDGKTVMTTQPKFVPNEAVKIKLNGTMNVNVRLIDCVGYPVEGAEGFSEQDKMRMVKTPWSEEDMPFEQAAELGTQKVIAEHSTIAVVVTNDGTITDIPRSKYVSAEERVVKELRKTDKPFIVVLNSKNPSDPDCRSLADALEEKYGVRVLPMDVKNMSAGEVEEVLKKILEEFPIRKLVMTIPKWMQTLKMGNWLISSIIEKIKNNSKEMNKMKDYGRLLEGFTEDENLFMPEVDNMKMGEGVVTYKVEAKPQLFYKVLSDFAGSDIGDEFSLMKFVSECSYAKQQYDRIESALKTAEEEGYGVVSPSLDSMTLEDPEIVKQGSKYGVRLRATAPSLHIMKVDVKTEVNPMMGTEQQSQYLLSEFQNNPQSIWETNMFGKSMSELAKETLSDKLGTMPKEAQAKIRKTVGRIVNENKGGLICILL